MRRLPPWSECCDSKVYGTMLAPTRGLTWGPALRADPHCYNGSNDIWIIPLRQVREILKPREISTTSNSRSQHH